METTNAKICRLSQALGKHRANCAHCAEGEKSALSPNKQSKVCGATSGRGGGFVCRLEAGHAGEHRDLEGSRWGKS